jgi:microcystin-dependent protein
VPSNFVAEIRMFAGSFAPTGWAFCDGQLLPISQNTALFSLIGTTYGGNGVSTFGLPDLRGRTPIHPGQGPGLGLYGLGDQGGVETATISPSEMPAHSHTLQASPMNGSADDPAGRLPARTPAAIPAYGGNPNVDLAANAVQNSGGNQPHNNMQPYLAVTYIIALQGIFPQRP